MESVLNSFVLVAISEMGDKTQLLALVLALRFRKPWTIMAGILVATLLNHGLASWGGSWIAQQVSPAMLRYILAGSFLVFGIWILIPDKADEGEAKRTSGAFITTLVTFFFAEMGDKTQLATIALGATYQAPVLVMIGTTLGMLASDGLAVFFGEQVTTKIPLKYVRVAAATTFFAFAVGIFFGLTV